MAENSKIEWCDHTVNLWLGCSKVHTGCKNCYAEYFLDTRYKKNLWGEKQPRQRIKSAFNDLDKYQKIASSENKLLKIFCGSMMDIFEDSKPLINPTEDYECTADLRNHLFQRISQGWYKNLIFLFLTKRPENIAFNVPTSWITNAPKNVWFGTSISNQETADLFIPKLLQYKPNNLFLSLEPQVGEVSYRWAKWHDYKNKANGTPIIHEGKQCIEFDQYDGIKGISWIIQGGESGHNKRDFNIDWAYQMKDNCQEANIPYFFKQIDKIQAIPNDLQIREFPKFEVGSACA